MVGNVRAHRFPLLFIVLLLHIITMSFRSQVEVVFKDKLGTLKKEYNIVE